ncbi:MAG: hypothetical protein WAL56_03390 [Candidatus Sulfotelmatobacter sp.]
MARSSWEATATFTEQLASRETAAAVSIEITLAGAFTSLYDLCGG